MAYFCEGIFGVRTRFRVADTDVSDGFLSLRMERDDGTTAAEFMIHFSELLVMGKVGRKLQELNANEAKPPESNLIHFADFKKRPK